jgi:translation initiation factor 2B subunit (eIF-2B alpha/beta/delta family)
MLSNGNLLGELGTSMISCIASNFKKPVIAFSETYKFWDKMLMNSIQFNNIDIQLLDSAKKDVII